MAGNGGQHTGTGPLADLVTWERALTRTLLAVGDGGDAGPIRSFEITEETFARAAGLGGDNGGQEALRSFKSATVSSPLVYALEDGRFPRFMASGELPGCFSYLVLTLAVAAFPDPSTGLGGDFREKLRTFTGIDRSFNDLSGVASMWRALQAWLDQRQADGLAFRRLVLPDIPPTWKHIGYTLRLAFPTKPDATLLTNFFTAHPGVFGHPRAFIHRFQAELGRDRASFGMKEAFKDFRTAFLSGNRLLSDHPFWRLAGRCNPRQRDVAEEATVDCTFDEDGIPSFSVLSERQYKLSARPLLLSEAAVVPQVAAFLPTAAKGFILFHQAGYGAWRSIGSLADAGGRVLIGCSDEAVRRLRGMAGSFVASGSWHLSAEPLKLSVAEEAVARLGGAPEHADTLSTVRVFGGIRIDGGWLGRPGYLPKVSAGGQEIRVRPGPRSQGDLQARGEPDAQGAFQLTARNRVDGQFFVEPAATATRHWSRRISFGADAYIHKDLASAASASDPLWDWRLTRPEKIQAKILGEVSWEAADGCLEDLAEAVYAGGRTGWDEFDLVALIRTGVRGLSASPWAVIRTLRDAGHLQPRLRNGWGGRIWTLNRPAVRIAGPVAIVEGATCARLAEEWHSACAAAGGQPFRRRGSVACSPFLLGCIGGDAVMAAGTLEWPVLPSLCVALRTPLFADTQLSTGGRAPTSRWDWERGVFVADGSEGAGPVGLTRWSHVRGADHDVYVVKTAGPEPREHRVLSRGAAVLLAHAIARRPLFRIGQGFLSATVPEACLPDRVAARLRLRHAANPGLLDGLAVYPCDAWDVESLNACMPGLIEDAAAVRAKGVAAVSYARHGRGRLRLEWKSGLTVGSTSFGRGAG